MKVLRKRDHIIKKVKSRRYWQRTHKYGIVIPKSVDEALHITNKEMGTEFWTKALEKEMKIIEPAFQFRDDDVMLVGYQHILDCHMFFDVKISLERSARYVAGGHQTKPTKEVSFTSVLVTSDSIHLAFLVAAH
jgi:hypothetical protein